MKQSINTWRVMQSAVLVALLNFTLRAHGAPLDAVGTSWLFPLNGDSSKNGFCNSPKLSSGLVISEPQFRSIVARVNADSKEQFCGGISNPVVKIMNEGDANFMLSCNHLAQLNGLRDELDRAASWHIVGFRFDPCVNATSRTLLNASDLGGCTSEARLIAQPFVVKANGAREVLDASLHLIYAVNGIDGVAEIVGDLKEVQEVTKRVSGGNYPPSSQFRAHPGLEQERMLDQCNGASAKSVTTFLAKHTNPSKLTQVAFMTSSGAVKQWTFGLLRPQANFQFGSTPTGRFDNFSDTLLSQSKFPINQENRSNSSIINITRSFELVSSSEATAFSESEKVTARSQLDLMNDLMNPKVTSQLNQSCIGCHMAPQLFNTLAARAGIPQAVGTRPFQNTLTFPDFPRGLRNFVNLRHFGYGSGFAPGVSLRSLNEIDRIRQDLNRLFP